jgi:UDP-N-acetyl-D-mannosaminuronate dehydrogenase
MKIGVLGLGYLELPTASLFAQNHKIIGVNKKKKLSPEDDEYDYRVTELKREIEKAYR